MTIGFGKNRVFDSKGKLIEVENDGDNFRLALITRLTRIIKQKSLHMQSILDIGSGQGGLGKGIARTLNIKDIYQADINPELGVHEGNILDLNSLPKKKYDLGLLIQVLRDISDTEKAIANIMSKSNYSLITNVDPNISRVNSETYFDFKWVIEGKRCNISTRFFDGTVHEYKKFYVHNKEEIENSIQKNGTILLADSWLHEGVPIYNFWITKNS